jgi:hypothetical protein
MASRCFFSFHYQDVIDFRANVVRNHNVTKDDNGGFFDASIWESAKKQGDLALKRLINDGLNNTSATVVLVGSETCWRRWVRYEIFKSIERGNKVIGIHINSIRDRSGLTKILGHDPFDYLAVAVSEDGNTGTPMEWDGKSWVDYTDLAPFGIAQQPSERRGKALKLSTWIPVYDWVANDGFNSFAGWVG